MTKKITTSACLVALATVLSVFAVFRLPNEGSVTIASMVPIIVVSLLWDFKWSLLVSFAYSLIQMMLGKVAPPTQDILSFFLVAGLDYIIAYTVLALAGPIYRLFGKTTTAAAIAGGFVTFLRFLCHLLSGIIIWDVYAPAGQSPFLYSLIYNGSYMLPEILITVFVLVLMMPFIKKNLVK